ncbi:hypothetical protein [Nonomuraea sp. NPDC001023]|uniref:hypothetical protein n=1 Tax=unclassified Nonomuraea TaxID=2593643 RepID=UPI0033306B9B
MQRMTGLLVGAVFGAVFVVVNAGGPLDGVTAGVLRAVACLAAAAVLAMWFGAARAERTARAEPAEPARRLESAEPARRLESAGPRAGAGRRRPGGRGMFGGGYVAVVVAEVVLLFGGLRVLAALGRPEEGNVAWVAFVVGVHFVALAPVWRDWSIAVPGAALTLLGAGGLVLAATPAVAWVPVVSGVLSGVVLLAGSLTLGLRGTARATA